MSIEISHNGKVVGYWPEPHELGGLAVIPAKGDHVEIGVKLYRVVTLLWVVPTSSSYFEPWAYLSAITVAEMSTG